MDKIPRDVFRLLFHDYDGRRLAPMRLVCTRWKTIIDTNNPYKALVAMRVRYVDHLGDLGLVSLREVSHNGTRIVWSRVRKYLKSEYGFDLYAYANYRHALGTVSKGETLSRGLAIGSYKTELKQWSFTFTDPTPMTAQGERLCLYDGGGDYWYYVSDHYGIPDAIIANARVLSERFPAVFSWSMAAFPSMRGGCLSGKVELHFAGSLGNCCPLGKHRGYLPILRIRKPPAAVVKRRVSAALPAFVKRNRKRNFYAGEDVEWGKQEIGADEVPEAHAAVQVKRARYEAKSLYEEHHEPIAAWKRATNRNSGVLLVSFMASRQKDNRQFRASAADTLSDLIERYAAQSRVRSLGLDVVLKQDFQWSRHSDVIGPETASLRLRELPHKQTYPGLFEIYVVSKLRQ